MKKPILLETHIEIGAEIGEFAGWRSPLWFSSVREEHEAVRNDAGVFDISHMTRIEIKGRDSTKLLEKLLTRDVAKTKISKMKYCLMLNENGGIIDDLTFYRRSEDEYILVNNAITRERVVEWISQKAENMQVEINDYTEESILLALQGPNSPKYLERIFNVDTSGLKWFSGFEKEIMGCKALITRSGYTGEDGFELNITGGDEERYRRIWEEMLAAGVKPCGLAARDMLRLECAYPLYGQDMDENTTPYEARLEWAVTLEKDFIGRERLEQLRNQQPSRLLVGLEMLEKAIPRRGYKIYKQEEEIGEITSGGMSYQLEKGIALAKIKTNHAKEENQAEVAIHGKPRRAKITLKPFIQYRIPK